MDTRPKQRLTDPRAAAARNIIYPALPDGHVPVVIQQHPEPNRHINPSLLISAQYAMLCSPAPYHPIAPDHPPANAKRATVDLHGPGQRSSQSKHQHHPRTGLHRDDTQHADHHRWLQS